MSSIPRLAPGACVLALIAACNGIVGIEEVYEGPRPAAGGMGGEAGEAGASTAGSKADGGARAEGGTDGSEPKGGSDADPLGGAPGHAGDGPMPTAGDGSGGAPEPTTRRVTGRVIDFWRHPLPNISVQVGDTLVTTNKNGVFTVDDAPATYDVSMVYTYPSTGQVTAWAYLGLTRRDPTLQMYVGSARRIGNVDITFAPKPTLGSNQEIAVAFGGADGANAYDAVSANGTTEYPDWYGPATAAQTAHALLWQSNAQKLPTSYLAYASKPVELVETDTIALTLDLSPKTIATGNVQGTVTAPGVATRHNLMFLRFASGATIQLVRESGAAETFSYLAPNITDAKIMIAASEGFAYDGYAVAYVDGVTPGAKPKLTIPAPMTPATPGSGTTNVDGSTRFSFGGETAGPYVVNFYSQDPDGPNPPASPYQAIYVVTAKKQFTLPTFLGGGFSLYRDRRYIWTVATHGAYDSMDALANEDGFLDPFSWDEETAQGPSRGQGEFTDSNLLEFRTAP